MRNVLRCGRHEWLPWHTGLAGCGPERTSVAASELLWQPVCKLAQSLLNGSRDVANPLLGQILGSVFANAMRGRARSGPFGQGMGGGGLGDLLGGMAGGRGRGGLGGNRGMLLAMLLPFAMQ